MKGSFQALKVAFDNMGLSLVLAGLALFAALAQAASEDDVSLKTLLIGAPMSGFVIWMTWVGLSYFDLEEPLRVFWSGVAAFSAQWILRGLNTALKTFAESPLETLTKIKDLWRGK